MIELNRLPGELSKTMRLTTGKIATDIVQTLGVVVPGFRVNDKEIQKRNIASSHSEWLPPVQEGQPWEINPMGHTRFANIALYNDVPLALHIVFLNRFGFEFPRLNYRMVKALYAKWDNTIADNQMPAKVYPPERPWLTRGTPPTMEELFEQRHGGWDVIYLQSVASDTMIYISLPIAGTPDAVRNYLNEQFNAGLKRYKAKCAKRDKTEANDVHKQAARTAYIATRFTPMLARYRDLPPAYRTL